MAREGRDLPAEGESTQSGGVVAPALGRWVSLANLLLKAVLYGTLSRSGRTRCNNAAQQGHRHTAFRLLQLSGGKEMTL
jgi:hypothetical protein